jgi:tRNA (guanine-N7-)-methyltransferase
VALPDLLAVAPVRTYHRRRGRLSQRHKVGLRDLWPRFGVVVAGGPAPSLDPVALFGRRAPLVVEIGSGMGETTVAMAADDPGRDYLAVEVYEPGIANLLHLIADLCLSNVRVAAGDALDLFRHQLPPASLAAIHVFFPDPWPKARHHKRRIIQPRHLPLLASRLVPGGLLHCATDSAGYAADMLESLGAEPSLHNEHDGFAPRPDHRPTTRFELRGIQAGQPAFDVMFRRSTLDGKSSP